MSTLTIKILPILVAGGVALTPLSILPSSGVQRAIHGWILEEKRLAVRLRNELPVGSKIDQRQFELLRSPRLGKGTVALIFPTVCGPCSMNTEEIVAILGDEKELVVVAAHQADAASFLKEVVQDGIHASTIIDSGKIAKEFRVKQLPAALIIDREGVVIRRSSYYGH